MNKLRFALIGCGRISKNHIVASAENKDICELVAVCDPVTERAEQKAAQYEELMGVRPAVYADYKKMLEEMEIDCCAIATESGYHAEIALYCIQHGKHVLVEKPMALSTADAEKMIAEAKAHKVTLAYAIRTALTHRSSSCTRRWRTAVLESWSTAQRASFGTAQCRTMSRLRGAVPGRRTAVR